jgi:LuxR family transcriptional regulator, quorum-sensing system regulator SdiA
MYSEPANKEANSSDLLQSNLHLKKQILFYDKIFANINAIVSVFDMNRFRLVWANEHFRKVLGYKRNKKSEPEKVVELYHPDDRDFLLQMKKYFVGNPQGNFTAFYKFRNAKGEYLWFYTTASVFRYSPDDNVFEVAAVSVDFTKQITYHKNLKFFSQEKLQDLNRRHIGKITKRELQIIKYFANGFKTREIAELLGLSFHTVNNHRKNVLRKLELKNLAALVNFAVENGLD